MKIAVDTPNLNIIFAVKRHAQILVAIKTQIFNMKVFLIKMILVFSLFINFSLSQTVPYEGVAGLVVYMYSYNSICNDHCQAPGIKILTLRKRIKTKHVIGCST